MSHLNFPTTSRGLKQPDDGFNMQRNDSSTTKLQTENRKTLVPLLKQQHGERSNSVFGQKTRVTLTHTSLNGKSSGDPGGNFLSECVFVCGCLACQTLLPPPPPPPPRPATSFTVKTSAHVNSPPWVRPE